jgi:hypothetical protein
MEISDIINYIALGSSKRICIRRDLLKEYPGYVRDISILEPKTVLIEFSVYNYDDGGLNLKFFYEDWNLLINSLENYLNQPIQEWENFNKSGNYPSYPGDNIDYISSGKKLKSDYNSLRLALPIGWLKNSLPSRYWLE